MARVGLFGGSFNPVHNGHLKLAEFALSEFNLDKVVFVPANRNAGKDAKDLLPAPLRVACLREAIRGKKRYELSTCEIRRGGTTYTVDTLKEFRRRLGPKAVVYFLAGADHLKDFWRWKSPAKVLKLSRFTILSRPGAAPSKTPPGALWASFPALEVSSSDVRGRIEKGRSVKGLVPARVEKLLRKNLRKAGSDRK